MRTAQTWPGKADQILRTVEHGAQPSSCAARALRRSLHLRDLPLTGCVNTLIALCLLVGTVFAVPPPPHPAVEPLLTTVRQVHDLPAELASHARVHLVATVTYYDPAEFALFIQDETGGVFIETDKPYPVHTGDLISVDGATAPSYFTEVGPDPVLHVLTPAGSPSAIIVPAPATSYAGLVSGEQDSKLATVRGVVRSINVEQHEHAPILHLDVNMPGGIIEVYQPIAVLHGGELPAYEGANGRSLLDTTVSVTGVVGGAFDTKVQLTGIILYAPDSSSLRVLQPAPTLVENLRLTDIDDVFHSRNVEDLSRRLRIRGVLTYYKHGDSAVLEHDGKSIFVLTRESQEIPIGAVVDAFGFASDQEYAPSLRQAELLNTGMRGTITPRLTTYDEALSGLYSDNLISIEGTVASEIHSTGVDTITTEVDGHLVRALFEGTGQLRDLRRGSRVRLTGICRIVPGGPWRAPALFHLEMRGPGDLAVLAPPPWYTVSRLLELLGSLLVITVTAIAWAMLLRHRVRLQTKRIERTMLIAERRSRLLEKISSNRPLDTTLAEICSCVSALLPGTVCRYHLDQGALPAEISSTPTEAAPQPEPDPAPAEAVLFSMALTNSDAIPVGRLSVSTRNPHLLLETRYEIFDMISEVAHLAMRQALLYQGLLHHSTHDSLTELPNRRLADHRLRLALADAEQNHSSVIVLYIDVNRFKQVNDKHGHRIGDLYLKSISSRLLRELRSTDTLARIGGDEFLIIVPGCTEGQSTELRERLDRCFAEPFHLEGIRIDGSASVGLATYPEHGTNPEDLKRYADHAMYLEKRGSHLSKGDTAAGTEPGTITNQQLQLALDRREFHVAYQPQFAADGQLRGVEALLRLEDPTLDTLNPEAFRSACEQCDSILKLGRWVLEVVLRDAVRCRLASGPHVLLIVHVAMRQLVQPDFAAGVLGLLAQTGLPPHRLELELAERTLVADNAELTRQLRLLRSAGVRISINNFGLGQSSLNHLHRLPIDTIKIDRSFVSAMETDPAVLPVIRGIASIGHRLHKRVVAEGIESTVSVPALLRMGNMDFQGYLLSQPISANQLEFMLPLWRIGLPMPAAFHGPHPSLLDTTPAAQIS